MTSTTPQILDNFRKSTIDLSIKSASQRLSQQRRLLNKDDAQEKKQIFETLAHEHFTNLSKNELNQFGLHAIVSNPGTLVDDPADKSGLSQKLISGQRVLVSAAGNNQAKQLFCGLDDGSITAWSVPEGKWIGHGMSGPSDGYSFSGFAVRGIAAQKDDLVASTHRNGILALWKFAFDESSSSTTTQPSQVSPLTTFKASQQFHHCKFSPTVPTCLATTSDDGSLKLWDFSQQNNVPVLFLSLENGLPSSTTNRVPPTRCLSFHADGAIVAVGDASGAFSLWDLRDASRIYNSASLKPLHTGRINDIQFAANGYNFCSGGDDGLLQCFDLRRLSLNNNNNNSAATSSANVVWRQAAHGDAVTSIAYGKTFSTMDDGAMMNDSAVIFSGGLDGLVVAWDSWTGEQVWRSDPEESSYVPLVSTSSSTVRPVRSLCYLEGGNESYLAVMRREPQWLLFSANCGNGNVKSITTDAQIVSASNRVINQQAAVAEDESDDDDDILGALRKK